MSESKSLEEALAKGRKQVETRFSNANLSDSTLDALAYYEVVLRSQFGDELNPVKLELSKVIRNRVQDKLEKMDDLEIARNKVIASKDGIQKDSFVIDGLTVTFHQMKEGK